MFNDIPETGSCELNDGSLLYCNSANEISRQFQTALASLEQGSSEWDAFLKASVENQNSIIQILSFVAIGKSGDPQWLEILFSRAEIEPNATVLSAIYNAIVVLGGFATMDECAALFESSDVPRRSAAMIVVDSLKRDDALKVLRDIVLADPDRSLRREAATRLAYLGSDAGLHELLGALGGQEYRQRVDAACALSALGNSLGLTCVRKLLKEMPLLSARQRTILLFSLQKLLLNCSEACDRHDDALADPAISIPQKASEWIENKFSTVGF